jgi:hypothetical protein
MAGKEIVKMAAYCINFYLIYREIHASKSISNDLDMQILLISINAALNYIMFILCEPLVGLVRIHNYKKPYVGYLLRIKLEISEFCKSL